MIAKDYQEVYECVIAMQAILASLGVKEPSSFGKLTRPAEAFLQSVYIESNRQKLEQTVKEQPEAAAAFASLLGDIRAEVAVVCGAVSAEKYALSRICMVSSEAVQYAIQSRIARQRRDGSGSGAYLSFQKD